MFVIAHIHEGFAYVEVFVLNNAVGLGVIWRSLDMMYALFFGQVSNCCYKCGAIVSNNFSHSTPLAQDILECKVSESFLMGSVSQAIFVLLLFHSPFGQY